MMRKMFFALMIAVGLISCSSVLITQAAETNKFGIKIDGNFDDWKDKLMTDIKNPWNGDPVKQASLLTDGKYIYYYITMSKTGRDNYPFQVNDHQLTVGNKMHSIYIKRAYDIPANKTKKVMLVDTSGGDVPMVHSPAVIHRYVKNGKEYGTMEARISFSDLKAVPTDAQHISIKVPLIGSTVVTAESGSTGPIVLAIVGLLIAILSFFSLPKLKRVLTK